MKRAAKRTLTVLSVLFGILLVLLTAALAYYCSVTAGVKLQKSKLLLDTACIRIYDNDGNEIMSALDKSDTPYEQFPDHLSGAFVSVEDKRFYEHRGLDYKRIVKAALKNIAAFSFREGASTISQQLIKNTHLSSEKTFNRKLKEFKLTRALEKRYSKNEIMELYLNSIYFGHSAFGVRRASKFYFGKDVCDVAPEESALLAALVRSPNRYSPFKNPEKCLARRNLVLALMHEQGYLSKQEYAAAKAKPLPEEPHESKNNAYLSEVYKKIDEIAEEKGTNLNVYTFYEPKLQEHLALQQSESDCCLLVRDNLTHGIKAFHSTCGTPKRLPASTIKPLLVYAPALEENALSPVTPLCDTKTDFNGYSPDDCGGASGKFMSARYALSHSVNIPAVRVLNALGVDKAASYLSKMDLPVEEDDRSLALALGGMKEGFTLLSLADGYATFANDGVFSPSSFLKRIEDDKGKTLYEYRPTKRTVFSEETCFLLNDMLRTAASEGTARKLKSIPFPVCAKTGTNEGANGNLDAYTIGYTRSDTVCAWLGNRDNSPIKATGGGLPANMVLSIFRTLYAQNAPAPFSECEGVVSAAYDLKTYENEHRVVLADPLAPPAESGFELFKKDAMPQDSCSRYSSPKIQKPSVYVKNGAVYIELCHTEYYDYEIKRQNNGKTTTIYKGKYQKRICDNSVRGGESYEYIVTPYYTNRAGESVKLPSVYVEQTTEIPKDWWRD